MDNETAAWLAGEDEKPTDEEIKEADYVWDKLSDAWIALNDISSDDKKRLGIDALLDLLATLTEDAQMRFYDMKKRRYGSIDDE